MSLTAFLKKLDEKNQPAQLRKQAKQVVQLYFTCALSSRKQQNFRNKGNTSHLTSISSNTYSDNPQEYKSLEAVTRQSEDSIGKKNTLQKGGADWTCVFTEFTNAIRVRQYSRAALKIYTGWVRKFPSFTESKEPTLLNTEDVKHYLI